MKRLVCSLDGTWNDDDGASPPTNVAKLNRAILSTDGNGVKQLVRYVVGIATAEDGGLTFLKGAVGYEISDRIKAGYQFLSNCYEPGDEIYLFGFSRGAYEARSLASSIASRNTSAISTPSPSSARLATIRSESAVSASGIRSVMSEIRFRRRRG